MNNRILDFDSLVTITCARLDYTRKPWQFWKPKVEWKDHYLARINSTGQPFPIERQHVDMLIPVFEAMEQAIRRELSRPW